MPYEGMIKFSVFVLLEDSWAMMHEILNCYLSSCHVCPVTNVLSPGLFLIVPLPMKIPICVWGIAGDKPSISVCQVYRGRIYQQAQDEALCALLCSPLSRHRAIKCHSEGV